MKSKRKSLIKKLDKLTAELIKLRDKNTCQWCGRQVEGSNCHWSHVISRSQGHALRWDLQNSKVLCYHCHINKWHLNPLEAKDWFKGKFPDRYEYLEARKNTIVKLKDADLLEMIETYKQKLKEL